MCVDYRLQIVRYANHIMHLPSYLSILLIFSFFINSIFDHILCRYTDVDHWTQKGQTKSVDDGFLGFEGKGEKSILFMKGRRKGKGEMKEEEEKEYGKEEEMEKGGRWEMR